MTQLHSVKSSSLLSCTHISWHIKEHHILNDISFDIAQGSFVGLIGANGAGKSSLLRCLYRYLKTNQGEVLLQQLNGELKNIWALSAQQFAQQVAVVLQETPSQFNVSVHQVVALGLVPHQTLFSGVKQQEKEGIEQALEHVGLLHKKEQSFESLSGGEKQRVLIARAIVQKPRLLIMDEPTSHLDVKYQIQIMRLAKSLGITVLASFHDLNLACAMCDQLLVLKKGQLVSTGTPEQVVTSAMLADVFDVKANVTLMPNTQIPHIIYAYDYLTIHSERVAFDSINGNQPVANTSYSDTSISATLTARQQSQK